MTLHGGCQCGAVRYTVSAEPLEIYVCHCRECRKQSASAFGISVIVPAAAFHVTQGDVREWTRPADSGNIVVCHFCSNCGSRLWHDAPGEATISVKGGSLDAPVDLSHAAHIWTAQKLAGIEIPHGVPHYPGEPPAEA
jgi:hypothetical protein